MRVLAGACCAAADSMHSIHAVCYTHLKNVDVVRVWNVLAAQSLRSLPVAFTRRVRCHAVVSSPCSPQESMKPMWKQVNETTELIKSLIAANASVFSNGYHFLGHSQGGLMMRSVIQNFDDHNVHTFVSMAGVQLGMCV